MRPEAILESVLYAEDLERAEGFYTQTLRLEVIAREQGRHVFFRCGSGVLLVFNPGKTSTEETFVNGALIPLHGAKGPGHLAFAMRDTEVGAWREHLAKCGVAIESEVEWPQGGHSIYLRDPAGNSIELVTPELWDPK